MSKFKLGEKYVVEKTGKEIPWDESKHAECIPWGRSPIEELIQIQISQDKCGIKVNP